MLYGIGAVLPHKSPEDWAETLEKKGFQACSFPVTSRASDAEIFAYQKALNDHNIHIAEVGIWDSPFSTDPKKAAEVRDYSIHQLELADMLGADCCSNVSGAVGPVWYAYYPENYAGDAYKRVEDYVRELLDRADPKRTVFGLEIMQWMLPDSVASYKKLIDDIGDPRFGAHLDPINLINSMDIVRNYDAVNEEACRVLGPVTASCHLKDYRLLDGTTLQIEECVVGTGLADIGAYIERIRAIRPDMPMLFEHLKNWEEYDACLAYVKSLEEKKAQ